jgi:hypothetical protein
MRRRSLSTWVSRKVLGGAYSARVRQDLHTLVRRFGGDVFAWQTTASKFREHSRQAREDERIATNKIETYIKRFTDSKRTVKCLRDLRSGRDDPPRPGTGTATTSKESRVPSEKNSGRSS